MATFIRSAQTVLQEAMKDLDPGPPSHGCMSMVRVYVFVVLSCYGL